MSHSSSLIPPVSFLLAYGITAAMLPVFNKTVAAARNYRPIQPPGLDSLKTLALSCTPIFKPGPLDEKRAAAFLDLPEHQRYPSRMS